MGNFQDDARIYMLRSEIRIAFSLLEQLSSCSLQSFFLRVMHENDVRRKNAIQSWSS